MATKSRNWLSCLCVVYCVIVYQLVTDLCMLYCMGFNYDTNTEAILCSAQCEALCVDNVKNCEKLCEGNRRWMTNCNQPNCNGTCSVLFNRYLMGKHLLVPVPTVTAQQTSVTTVELSWQPGPLTPLATFYVIEKMVTDPKMAITSVTFIGWIKENHYSFPVSDVCELSSYRVMAVNQAGSRGFSSPIHAVIKPSRVENIHFSGSGVYYYPGHPPDAIPELMAILEVDPPAGWKEADIFQYEWNYKVQRHCPSTDQDSIPIFEHMNGNGTANKILLKISAGSIGCIFTLWVRAESKCHVVGPWTNFTVDLTNTSTINGYVVDKPLNPPGKVTFVKLNVTEATSPFEVELHIEWQPPSDVGSHGVNQYIIRSGKAERNYFPLPPSFIEAPSYKIVSKHVREISFHLKTQTLPYTYGVQVVAIAQGQVIKDNEWGRIEVYTLIVDRNSSFSSLQNQGRVLLNADGVVVVHVNNTRDVEFMWDMPQSRMSNLSVGDFALQWGPYVGPQQNMVPENTVVVPGNQTTLRTTLHESSTSTRYGLKIKSLFDMDEDLDDVDWDSVELYNFTLPDASTEPPITDKPQEPQTGPTIATDKPQQPQAQKINADSPNLTPLYIVLPVILIVTVIVILVKLAYRRSRLKHLERRLHQEEEDEEEEGHYYVMRSQQNEVTDPDAQLIPTVVPDQWELPHSCIKTGRILGSGAFGQVVKGRVSKSLMHHRGINIEGAENKAGTHVTVAIKMLQEFTEERYRIDFLNEIKMMKDIGYHRNIVSILGCCTLREPYCLVVEYVPHGDLLTHLRKIRSIIEQREHLSGPYVNQEVDLISPLDLLSYARQVTVAMEFLSQKGFVHRDLAARNILLGNNKTVKVGDFGLTRYIYQDLNKVYVNRRGGKLPLKWMSLEAIFDMTFSAASDVWAFGVLLFEIVSLGGSPYPHVANVELLRELRRGYRMERPDNCSQEIYNLMLWCWKGYPGDRPSFSQLRFALEDMIADTSGLQYLDFKVDSKKDYYHINSDEMDDLEIELDMETQKEQEPARDEKESDVITWNQEMNCDVVEEERVDDKQIVTSRLSSLENESDFVTKCAQVQNDCIQKETENNLKEATLVERWSRHDLKQAILCNGDGCFDAESPVKSRGQVLSVHNDIYNVLDDDDGIPRHTTEHVDSDSNSQSSDEVFSDCEECPIVNGHCLDGSECSNMAQCVRCGRLNIRMTRFDLHLSERTDSAFSSTSSEERSLSNNQRSETSESSNEYLMPDSPESDRKMTQAGEHKLLVTDGTGKNSVSSLEQKVSIRSSSQQKKAANLHRRIQSLDSLGIVEGDSDSPEVKDATPYVTSESLWKFRRFHSAPFLLVCDSDVEVGSGVDGIGTDWSVLDTYL